MGAGLIATSGDAEELFRSHRMLRLDGLAWTADFAVIQTGLEGKKRAFKSAFKTQPIAPAVGKELNRLRQDLQAVFADLYPNFRQAVVEPSGSFRPMITGPEPMHYDTYATSVPVITAFVNVATTPRVYNVGPSFDQLFDLYPQEMLALVKAGPDDDMSWRIREETRNGRVPLGPSTPKTRVEFPPGSVWFFSAKTLAHEVIYGEGAYALGWEAPGCAETQNDIIRRLAC